MLEKLKAIYDEVITTLQHKLPDYLTYHTVEHTKYVLDRATHIGQKENVSSSDLFLLQVAALYHDIGFIEDHQDHEAKGCRIARKQLTKRGFGAKELDQICGMIMATKIPQKPKTHLEKILADADLEYLATSKFLEVGETLFQELSHRDNSFTRSEWNKLQIDFLENHEYHTEYCRRYKSWRKQRNLVALKDK